MDTYHIILDHAVATFYEKVADRAGISAEQVLADALYKLAGSLSLEAIAKNKEKDT